MKRPYTANPGVSLQSIALPGSVGINGIQVDNPSGGWLYIVELNDYCPPYTLQWKRDLEYMGSSLTVRYGVSPAGQVSTTQGDPYTITLNSEFVGNDAGIPDKFIEQFNPIISAFITHTYTIGNAPATIASGSGPVPGKRIRVHGAYLHLTNAIAPPTIPFTPIILHFEALGVPDTRLRIAASKVHDERQYIPYVDMPVGIAFNMYLQNPTNGYLDALFTEGATQMTVEGAIVYELI